VAVLLSGDFHANAANELTRITKRTLIGAYGQGLFNEIGYHVILGDGGFLWPGNEKADACLYKTLALRPFPLLCVIGNHEPVLGRQDLPEVDIGIGEKVILVHEKPLAAYLKRGKVYTIGGTGGTDYETGGGGDTFFKKITKNSQKRLTLYPIWCM
jgi:hypothetical protein